MRKKLIITLIIMIFATVAYAATKKFTEFAELTTIADVDILLVVDDVSGTATSKKITVLNFFDTINTYTKLNAIMADLTLTHNGLFDTFSELNTIVADKTLVNEEDAVTWDALGTFGLGITITTGDPFILGTTRWDNGSDLIDGERIANDTIDDDSIDWSDCTFADFDYETNWKMWYSNGAGDVTELTLGANGTFLESNGASAAPAFRTLVDGDIPDTITITNISQVADMSASAAEINTPLDGATVTLTEFQELQTIDATTISANQWAALGSLAETLSGTEINILDGVTGVTAAELSYIGDVTGLIQSQIDGKEGTLSDKASLESTISDVTRFVTEAVMPVAGTDPDVDAAGELSIDTDGGNEPNSITLRTFMGTDDQAVLADTQKPRQFTITEPDTLAQSSFLPIWKNNTGFTFIITAISGESDIDNFDFTIKERDADGANVTTIEAVQLTTDGTAMYYGSVAFADLDHTAIEAGHTLGYDNSADDATYVQVVIEGYFNADVN